MWLYSLLSFRGNFPVTLEKLFCTTKRVENEKRVVSNTNVASARGKITLNHGHFVKTESQNTSSSLMLVGEN